MNFEKKPLLMLAISAFLLAAAGACSLAFGSVSISRKDLLAALGGEDSVYKIIVMDLRLPRTAGAALAGAALAMAGSVLQCVTDNSLCAPNIIGVNSGAGLFVMLILCLAPDAWMLLPLAAFAGAMCATAVVMGISFRGGGNTHGTSIVLSGVAVSAILNAGISFLSLRYPDVLSSYTAFSVGGFSGVRMSQLTVPALVVAACFCILQLLSPALNLLCLGDEIAVSLGVKVRFVRLVSLIVCSALCAAAVSFAGLLGFVGLIVPNAVRRLAGVDMRFDIGLCAVCGAFITVLSDLVARVLFAPAELPAGIIMAVLGSPFFLYLLIKRRRSYDTIQ